MDDFGNDEQSAAREIKRRMSGLDPFIPNPPTYETVRSGSQLAVSGGVSSRVSSRLRPNFGAPAALVAIALVVALVIATGNFRTAPTVGPSASLSPLPSATEIASPTHSSSRPSASPANIEMPSSVASLSSGVVSGDMARHPETWKPPITTWMPAARKGPAMSMARGNWLDCTPTNPTMPFRPRSFFTMRFSGSTELVSSYAWTTISTSSPKTRRRFESRARP